MQDHSTSRPDGRGQGLFSPPEIERAMRVEFERAQRHGYPIVCMIAGIDRLSQLQDLYGRESQEEILRSVTSVLRASTRDSDLVGWLSNSRILALFPHTPPDVASLLAKRVLSGVRKLRFDRDGKTLGVSLSVGVAHNQHEGSLSFDTLVQVAEEGLAVADAAGGDRYVETELYQLYEGRRRKDSDRERHEATFAGAAVYPGPAPVPAPAPVPPARKKSPAERLIELLSEGGHAAEEFRGLDLDTVVRAIHGLREGIAKENTGEDIGQARTRIDQLERRIAKLTHLLGMTEEELTRVAAMKGIDLGISSVYRHVQGLSADAANRDQKVEMMKQIFQANVDLQGKKKKAAGGDTPA